MRLKRYRRAMRRILLAIVLIAAPALAAERGLLVLQTDYGTKDQAVAALRGVARSVDRNLVIDDLTHEIPAFDIFAGSYRLNAVIDYWPKDTVFVSVVDPGVGTERRSIVARFKSGQLLVTPDNGTLTLIADRLGVDAIRTIDESRNRLPGSEGSYTFHGRDIYAYVGAQLACGRLRFEDVGPLQTDWVRLEYEQARRIDGGVAGGVPVLDPQYGNVWTNIPAALAGEAGLIVGRSFDVVVRDAQRERYRGRIPFVHTFGDVAAGAPLLYVNSVGMMAIALNLGNFAASYSIAPGRDTHVEITAARGE
jgi:S-adenosylmethionine hydrolase